MLILKDLLTDNLCVRYLLTYLEREPVLADFVHRRHVERFQQRERLFVGAVDVGGAAEEGLGRESAESGTSIRREEGIMPG